LHQTAPQYISLSVPRSTKPQYFLSFAVLGSIIPSFSLLLAERGLTKEQIGNVWAISSLSVILTPILITFLADTHIAPRRLMAALFALAGVFLYALMPAKSFWPIVALYSFHMFALWPVFPLQDGIHFAAQAIRRGGNLPEVPYHTVRVWGTIGYIIPGAALYFLLRPGQSMNAIIPCGVVFCALGMINAYLLPHTPAPPRDEAHSRLPTVAALRAIAEPHVLVFCIAMFLVHMASQAYYQFYPLHLTERCGIDKRYVGLIANVGVIFEIFFMLSFAFLVKHLTLRRVMYLGALAIAVRMFFLAAFPNPAMAIAVQLLHGMTVLVVHVAPPVFLDQHADNRYRNSMQGLYTMAFAGAGRVIGSLASGWVAQKSLALTFALSACVCLIATLLFYFAFHDRRHSHAAG
jgi:PPP family 3-phenylpropionic acid transporter